MAISRRSFITSGLASAGAFVAGRSAQASDLVNLALPSLPVGGPAPKYPNIHHVVVVMMENRSADHYLGWWGDREDVRFDASTTPPHPADVRLRHPRRAELDRPPLRRPEPRPRRRSRSRSSTRRRRRRPRRLGRRPPGLRHRPLRPQLLHRRRPAGHQPDRAGLHVVRPVLQLVDGQHVPEPVLHALRAVPRHHEQRLPAPVRVEQPGRVALGFTWPTLWDQLNAAGVTWRYYFSNLPAIALFGARHAPNTRPITDYYADAAAGTLPQVSFVDPFFVAPEGLANDDHPHADIRLGQEFYSDVTTAFMRSPDWRRAPCSSTTTSGAASGTTSSRRPWHRTSTPWPPTGPRGVGLPAGGPWTRPRRPTSACTGSARRRSCSAPTPATPA